MVNSNKEADLKNVKNQGTFQNVKKLKNFKKAKIIVRNLPFKNLSEKSVQDFFKEYGDIEEVKLLKKDDGKFLGCGFVQFKKVSSAAKAIRYANEREMTGRKIVVDWALPKKTFLEKIQKFEEQFQNTYIKSEVLSDVDESIEFVIDKNPDHSVKYDLDEFESGDEDNVSETEEAEEGNGDGDDEDEDEDEDEEEEDKDEDEEDFKGNYSAKNEKMYKNEKKIKTHSASFINKSDDVEDGRTVFVTNIPFSATNEDLKNCFASYGPVEYALICIDKLTEHSKGTGFVKFKDKDIAVQCIKNSTKIYLHDTPLIIKVALSKANLESKKNSKKTIKDSRNLYLIREGMVIAGSKAAAGVSAGDMAKRLQLEQWKNQILKNLNMFISKTRLVIHNLPPSYDDSKLRNLFIKYSNPKAVIKEAKVMYDKKKQDTAGRNISKEVGFVSFTDHEDALQALRNINNNPEIFTPKKRPIVAFSIESKAVINSKLKRIEKSRAKLGVSDAKSDKLSKLNRKQRRFIKRRNNFIKRRRELKQKKLGDTLGDLEVKKNESHREKEKKNSEAKPKESLKSDSVETSGDAVRNSFTGVISESGKKIKLRSKFRLKTQANIHSQTLKKERRKRRERERKKMTLPKAPKEKKGKPKLIDDSSLSKLLKKHRESIQQSSVTKKWYDS